MEVSGQLNTLDVLLSTQWRGWVGPRASGCGGKEKISLHLLAMELQMSSL